MATQTCNNAHSFSLSGQGTFTIPPACSLQFNGATFVNNEPTEINHHQPLQPTPILTFSSSAILDNKLDFPDQRPSFVTRNESIIAHAVLALFLAIMTLLTELIYNLTAHYTNNNSPHNDSDSISQHNEPSAPAPPTNPHNAEQNIQMYPRHSRILSPLDIEQQWGQYK